MGDDSTGGPPSASNGASSPTIYSGYRLSEILAVGRKETAIACKACNVGRTYDVVDLIGRLGDEVLHTTLTRLTPRCPRRRADGRCMMVFTAPLTREEGAAIMARRASGDSPYPWVDWKKG